ncbi:MAG: hypothetical protein RIS47_305 [Bacteroidota bacterium]
MPISRVNPTPQGQNAIYRLRLFACSGLRLRSAPSVWNVWTIYFLEVELLNRRGCLERPVGWLVIRHMAVGQLKVLAQRTYGVTNAAADGSSPESSGSPQRCDAAAAS